MKNIFANSWETKKMATLNAAPPGSSPIHFLHIGKTGGTAIKEALQKSSMPLPNFILHDHDFKLMDVPPGEKVVFFVRDPVRRFASGFNSRKRKGLPKYHSDWTPEEEQAFQLFATPNDLAMALSHGGENQQRAEKALRAIHHVKTSYWDWFNNEEYFLARKEDIYFVGSQEQLNSHFALLKSLINLPRNLTLPTDDMNAHRNPKTMDASLSEEAIINLRKWYERDYHFLDLCKDLIGNTPANRNS